MARGADGRLVRHVRAPSHVGRRGEPWQHRHLLAGQHDRGGTILPLERNLPRRHRLVGVGRPQRHQSRNGAQHRQLVDRLVRRPVLADADRVVRADVDDGKAHQRRQPDRRLHVVEEDEEGAAERADAAVRRQPVHAGTHRVLAHAPVHGAARDAGPECAADLLSHTGTAREVGRPADQVADMGQDRLQGRRTRLPGLDPALVGGEGRQVAVPAVGQLAPLFPGIVGGHRRHAPRGSARTPPASSPAPRRRAPGSGPCRHTPRRGRRTSGPRPSPGWPWCVALPRRRAARRGPRWCSAWSVPDRR